MERWALISAKRVCCPLCFSGPRMLLPLHALHRSLQHSSGHTSSAVLPSARVRLGPRRFRMCTSLRSPGAWRSGRAAARPPGGKTSRIGAASAPDNLSVPRRLSQGGAKRHPMAFCTCAPGGNLGRSCARSRRAPTAVALCSRRTHDSRMPPDSGPARWPRDTRAHFGRAHRSLARKGQLGECDTHTHTPLRELDLPRPSQTHLKPHDGAYMRTHTQTKKKTHKDAQLCTHTHSDTLEQLHKHGNKRT